MLRNKERVVQCLENSKGRVIFIRRLQRITLYRTLNRDLPGRMDKDNIINGSMCVCSQPLLLSLISTFTLRDL
jgi:hypothetical protein